MVVEITDRSPKPKEGWTYDSGTDTFTPDVTPIPPVDVDAEAAQVLVNVSGKLSTTESSNALKLLLTKVYGL